MADVFSPKQRSRIMSKIRGKNSHLELFLRRALFKQGLRFRKHYGKRKIDIAFPTRKIAIFIDSCFWHSCPKHGQIPKSNRIFWKNKLSKNALRDKKVSAELRKEGWLVIRTWEHDITTRPSAVIKRISRAIKKKN